MAMSGAIEQISDLAKAFGTMIPDEVKTVTLQRFILVNTAQGWET